MIVDLENNALDCLEYDRETVIKELCNKYLNECPDFSAEQINSFINIDENNLSCFYEESIINESADNGVNIINQSASTYGKQIVTTIKKDGLNKESKKKISSIINDFYQEIADSFNNSINIDTLKFEKYDANKINRAISLLISVIAVQMIIKVVLSPIVGPAANILLITIAGPIVEEIAKQVSIKGKFDKEFFIVFNSYEFAGYMRLGKALGISGKTMFLARSAAVGLHALTTIIQKITNSDKLRKSLKIKDNDKESKDKVSFIGHLLGVFIHSGWNTLAIMSR